MDISQFHGAGSTWVIKDKHGRVTLPFARIGSITATTLDIVVWENHLVWLSVIVPTTGINMQDARHIVAILAGSGDPKKRNRQRAGQVQGYVHPVFTGEKAPDDPTMLTELERKNYIDYGTIKDYSFNNHPTWHYEHVEKQHPEAGALEFIYYAQVFDNPNGIWLLPVMTNQAEREKKFYEQVQRCCPSLECHPDWSAWLYQWCGEQHKNPNSWNTIKPRDPIDSAGQLIGFKLSLQENMIAAALSQALKDGELARLKGM